MIEKWTVLTSEYLHKQPWLTVRCERLRLPNGNCLPTYYVFEYPEWINTTAITRDGKFVMVRQYRHGIGEVCTELCAGVMDPEDASPMVAAQRELMEETGFGGGEWEEYMVISCNPGTHSNLTHCFLAKNVERLDTQHLEPTEDIEVLLLTAEEVHALLEQNGVRQSLHAAPLWKYFANHPL